MEIRVFNRTVSLLGLGALAFAAIPFGLNAQSGI